MWTCLLAKTFSRVSLRQMLIQFYFDVSMMNGLQVALFIVLQPFVVVTGFSRSVYFTTRENTRLTAQVVKRVDASSVTSCDQFCLITSWCTSTNFQISPKMNGRGTCELNKHEFIDENSDDFRDQVGVTFSLMLKGCLLAGCLNGGSCLSDQKENSFSCSCKPFWTGEKCENKIGIGWHPYYPANSCKNIRDVGESRGDGEYWIDPEKSGNPFKVYCEMTTDGGGWLLIANVVKDNVPIQPSLLWSFRAVSDYQKNNIILSQTAMRELRSSLSFTQLRFHCKKQDPGRTFHVTTAANSTGEAVVQYFSGQTDEQPDACGSYVRMEDDESKATGVCQKWGKGLNKWGSVEIETNETRLRRSQTNHKQTTNQ